MNASPGQAARLLSGHGAVVDVSSLGEQMATGLREQQELYELLAPDVPCRFLDNASFNAIAVADGTGAAIGVYLGATVTLARYAYCLLADPSMLVAIGDPSKEELEPSVIEALRKPNDPLAQGRYLPRDPARLRAAQHLALGTYLILFFHELAHVELCHLDLLRAEFGVAEHREIASPPWSEADASLLRALEWDADNAALGASLDMWRQLYAGLDYSVLEPLGPVISWYLAAQLLFWVMDFMQPAIGDDRLATHLTPEARMVNARLVAARLEADFDPRTENEDTQLIPWVVRNRFPSKHVAAVVAGGASIDALVEQLVAARTRYRALVPALERFQKPRGVLRAEL
jgi:hypothetical protein